MMGPEDASHVWFWGTNGYKCHRYCVYNYNIFKTSTDFRNAKQQDHFSIQLIVNREGKGPRGKIERERKRDRRNRETEKQITRERERREIEERERKRD